MSTIQCKAFYSLKCGHSRRFLDTSWKKLQKEFTEIDGYTIEYQGIENTPENKDIFTLYGINAYPKTFLSFEHEDGTRRLEAIGGNAPYERCETSLKDAVSKIVAGPEEWNKHVAVVKEAKAAEMEERRLMAYARAFLKKPDVKQQLKEFADSEEKLRKERVEAKKLLAEAEEKAKIEEKADGVVEEKAVEEKTEEC